MYVFERIKILNFCANQKCQQNALNRNWPGKKTIIEITILEAAFFL